MHAHRLAQVMQDASTVVRARPKSCIGATRDFRPALAQQQIIVSDAAEGAHHDRFVHYCLG